MPRLLIFSLCIISVYTSLAQTPEPFKELQFLNYNPNWISVSQDETFQTVQQWDQYSRILPSFKFYQPSAIISGNYLFSALRTGTWDLEGFLLEKRNLKTGKIVWKKTHDMRNHSRQEAPFSLRIKDSGELQLINYRRISPPDNPAFPGGFAGGGDDSHLSIMEFDTATGELVRHLHPASNDTTAAMIRQYFKYRTQLLYLENDTFQWVNYRYDYPNNFPGAIGVYSSDMIYNGSVLQKDSALHTYDTNIIELSDIGSDYDGRCFQYSLDSLYCVNYIYSKTDRSIWTGRIDLYDRHLVLQNSFDISSIVPFSNTLKLVHVSSNRIILYSTDFNSNDDDDDRIISLDKNGNLNEILYLKDIINPFISYARTSVIESPLDDGLIVFSLDFLNQLLYIMKSDGQGNLTVIHTLETFLPSYVANPIQLMYDSLNNNLVAHLMHARFEYKDDRYPIYHGNWSNWVSMPLDDFVSVDDQDQVQTKFASVYPNPTAGELSITYPFGEGDMIRVYTNEGKLINTYRVDIPMDILHVNLPNGLASGMYFIQCHDKDSRFNFSNSVILE